MTYRVDESANISGTSFHGLTIRATTAELEELFGPAGLSDGYKVSHEWDFVDESGNVFTLYAWKDTPLYSESILMPSPDQTRNWHIGHRTGTDGFAFSNWLHETIYDHRGEFDE
jgi:hypothetical protein